MERVLWLDAWELRASRSQFTCLGLCPPVCVSWAQQGPPATSHYFPLKFLWGTHGTDALLEDVVPVHRSPRGHQNRGVHSLLGVSAPSLSPGPTWWGKDGF